MSLKSRALLLLATLAGSATATPPLLAATRVAAEPGFSGYFGLGINSARIKSNLIAGDTGNEIIDDLGDASKRESSSFLTPTLSITYTFDNLRTEAFLGSSIEDFIRLDFNTLFGMRQQVSNAGVFEAVVLRSPSPTEIWSDPYATGVERDETEREANGYRLEWGAILNSGFDIRFSRRFNEVDDENSGDALLAANLITPAEQQLLERDGVIETSSLIYNWDRSRGQLLSLTANYVRHNIDGEAMAFDGYSLQLTNLTALNPSLRLSTNLLLGRFDHDTENPVFGKKNDKDLFAATLALFFSNPFGAKGWIANTTLAFAREDNEIDFYDTNLSLISLGMLRRF